jgi:hypothetical protein
VIIDAPIAGDGYWECGYEIGWPEGVKRGRTRGFDGVQALYLVMQAIAVQLYASPHHASGTLCWDRPGRGYGFPMPKPGFADLVGEDRLAQLPD